MSVKQRERWALKRVNRRQICNFSVEDSHGGKGSNPLTQHLKLLIKSEWTEGKMAQPRSVTRHFEA